MRRLIALAALFLAAPSAPAVAQTAEERAQLDWVLERGRLLYALDRAAWVATDDLLARMPDPESLGLAGYIVEEAGEGYAVTFHGGPRDRPVALYVARVEDGRVIDREIFPAEARPALSAPQRRLVAARDAARGSIGVLVSRRHSIPSSSPPKPHRRRSTSICSPRNCATANGR